MSRTGSENFQQPLTESDGTAKAFQPVYKRLKVLRKFDPGRRPAAKR